MDFQDARNNTLSGHENHGVYICHKCGWPFPNPHPSARHRRAHKKICGTIEGYNKLTGSEEHNPFTVSEDEHNSDEDRQTPNPKIEKRIITEMSCRSEDDVFSDAVTDFLDSGFSLGTEEQESDRNIAKSLEAELDASQLLKVDATNDITKPLNSPTGSSEVYNPEVTESATTTLQETRIQEFGIALSSINGLPHDLSPIKSEIPMDAPKNNINANVGDNGKQELMTCLGQETGVNGNEEEDVGKILKDVESPLSKTTTTASEAELKSQETDGKASDLVSMDAIIGSKQEQSDGLGLEMDEHDVPPEVGSVQIKAESAQEDIKGVGTHGDPVECDAKGEEKDDLHVLSVTNDLNANVGDNGKQELITCIGQETGVKGNEEEDVGKILKDVEAPLSKTTTEASEAELKSQETDGKASDPVTMDAIIVSKQEQSDGLGLEMVEHNVPPEVESVQIKSEYAQEDLKGVGTDGDPVEFCDAKGEEKEDLHVLSVANDLPVVVDQPEIMLEDFKDHKSLKSNLSLTLVGSAEVIKPVEIDNEDVVHEEESLSSSHLADKPGAQSIPSSADMNAMEGEENKLIIEVPFEGEAETSEFKVTSSEDLRSNGLEASPGTSRIERQKIQTHQHLQGSQPQSFEKESPRAECTTIDLPDAIPIVTSVNRTNNLGEGENADDLEMGKFVAAENESREEGVLEKLPPTVEEYVADSSSVSKVSQTSNLPGRDVTGEHEEARIELPDISRTESTEGATVEENFLANTKPDLEYVGHFSESTYLGRVPDSTEVEFDTSDLTSMTHTHSDFLKRPDEDSPEVIKESEISKDSEVVAECVGAAVGMGSESNHITDAGVSEKISETSISKEPKPLHIDYGFTPHSTDAQVSEKNLEKPILEKPGAFPLDSGFTTTSCGTSEDSNIREGSKGSASGVSCEPKQEEGDEKLPKQHFGVSAADISVDSSSQTDSLEGNWGSVSVLSIQSDAPTYIGAEAGLPSTDDSQAATAPSRKSEKGNLEKPNSAASDKSEVFEPPSFMTLVKPADQKGGVDSEIEPVPQPNSEALQAGWFPSLTNVVNESQGRKKNEEIIAKVTNWSAGKQHSPLKTLLSEANAETKAKSPNPKQTQKDESGAKNNGSVATTVMGSEVGAADEIGKRERGKDWYPTHNNNKKDKRKGKGKLSWVPFVCCSSIN